MQSTKNKGLFILNLALLIVFLVLFFVILCLVVYDKTIPFDNWFYDMFVRGSRSVFLDNFFKYFTYFGSTIGLIIIVLLFLIFDKDKKIGITLSIGLILSGVLNLIIKLIVKRPRPEVVNVIVESGYSFPSAHAMMSFVVFGLIIYYVYKKVQNKSVKFGLIVALSCLIFMLGLSRIYLGVHYLSDVLAGWCIGYVLTIGIIFLSNIIFAHHRRQIKL